MVSMDAADKIKAGAKFGRPAIGILTTIYDIGVAQTPYDRCVAGVAGGFGVVGDVVGGAEGAFAGSLVLGAEAVTVPTLAIGGAYVGGEWMKDIGAKVGAAFCQ
jgi:hypothetical protein